MAEEIKSGTLKRKRACNYSAEEKGLLADLVARYAGVIECKKTDGTTMKEKEGAWQQVADEYNCSAVIPRDWQALKTVRLISVV